MFGLRSTSSGIKSTSSQIITMAGGLMGVDVEPPMSLQSRIKIWDSEDSNTSGKTLLAEVFCDAGLASVNHEYFAPVVVNRGIYVEVDGAATNYIVRYVIG